MFKIKYNIGFSFNRANGGPSNFLKNLKQALKNNNLSQVSYFVNPFTSFNIYANKVRNPWKKPYFFRVDGVGFDNSQTEEHTMTMNADIVKGINEARGVIYQSEYSKKLCEQILQVKPIHSTIIINGTNLDRFKTVAKNIREELNIPKESIVLISSARWRPQKRLKDMLETFKRYRETYQKDIFFIVIGIKEPIEMENVFSLPFIPNEDLPNYLNAADIYMFFSWLDPCPNSVVEAIAAGLPVLCSNQGGTKEIVNISKGGLVIEADRPFNFKQANLQSPPKPDIDMLLEGLHHLVCNIDKFKRDINTEPLDINNVAKKYYNFFKTTHGAKK